MSGDTERVQEQAQTEKPVAVSVAGAVQRRIAIRHALGEPGINRVQAWCPICEWAGTPTFDQEQARAEARQHAEQAPYVTEREALAVMAAARGGSERARREAHHLHAPPTATAAMEHAPEALEFPARVVGEAGMSVLVMRAVEPEGARMVFVNFPDSPEQRQGWLVLGGAPLNVSLPRDAKEILPVAAAQPELEALREAADGLYGYVACEPCACTARTKCERCCAAEAYESAALRFAALRTQQTEVAHV